MPRNRFGHTVDVVHYHLVPRSAALDNPGSSDIQYWAHRPFAVLAMLTAVEHHDEPRLQAKEVHDVRRPFVIFVISELFQLIQSP